MPTIVVVHEGGTELTTLPMTAAVPTTAAVATAARATGRTGRYGDGRANEDGPRGGGVQRDRGERNHHGAGQETTLVHLHGSLLHLPEPFLWSTSNSI